MRRIFAIAGLVLVLLALGAGPAAAQRDPFEPLIKEQATTTGGGVTIGEGPSVQPAPPVGSETLANTGSDLSPWVALSYGLLCAGGAAVVLARTLRPAPLRGR